jgi:hypothetical protein
MAGTDYVRSARPGGFRRYPVSTGPVGTMDTVRLKRVVNVMQQFLRFPNFNIDSMLMGGG